VTIDNYCQVASRQTSDVFISCLDTIHKALKPAVRKRNFGVTLDVGHLNIDGEDPLAGAERVGRWCLANDAYLRLHATDNYGRLLFGPPHYSADIHASVSGRGVNNPMIILMLRSMGLSFPVVAEQIKPLSDEDIQTIHVAQTEVLTMDFEQYVEEGRQHMLDKNIGELLGSAFQSAPVYQFLAGIHGIHALQEYAVFRRIQDQAHLSVDEARKISADFCLMSTGLQGDLTAYMDDLLLPMQAEAGAIRKTQLDLVCQNISDSHFWISNTEDVDHIFGNEKVYSAEDTICKQGEPGSNMYYIKTGRVKVDIDGSQVASLGPGEIFGEISLFYSIPRSATVSAEVNDTRLGILDRENLEQLLACRLPVVYDLILRLFKVLPDRLRNMNDKYCAAIHILHLTAKDHGLALSQVEKAAIAGTFRPKSRVLPTFSAVDMERIAEEKRIIRAKETIIELADEGDGVFFVISGKVQVTMPNEEGEIILGEIGPGEVFGEMALIDDKPRSARVSALSDCVLAFVSRTTFNLLLQQKSSLAYQLMGIICSGLFERILHLDNLYAETKCRHRALAAGAR